MIQYYRVADHIFAIEANTEQFSKIPNYAPFLTDESTESHVLIIHVREESLPSSEGWKHLYTDQSDEDMPRIEMYQKDDEWLFLTSMYRDAEVVCAMQCSADWKEAKVFLQPDNVRFAIDNALMLLFAFATADKQTLLFHSSVIVRQNRAFMFLGHSGTGKSTHSQQWQAAFEDAHLLNDDNPVVRILPDGIVRVYGSPWSGKTACYKNESAPVQALVQLAQAPENKVTRLKMTQAYPYILASVSGLKVLPDMMDRIFDSIAQLLEISPVYRLECLPNLDAARLCAQTCSL